MNRILLFLSVAIFSIFLGSQITEGVLLAPYWKSLSTTEFYEYYSKFGPIIGRFYSILTIIAVVIPFSFSIYCYFKKSHALKYSILSSFFAFLVIAMFFIYFKGANQEFLAGILDTIELQSALDNWQFWHWVRVLFEFISLIFLILTLTNLNQKKDS